MDIRRLVGPALFGAIDGLTVFLGVMFPLLGHPHELVVAAVGTSLAEAVGMAGGEWLSDSDSGWKEAVVIGAATSVASVLPAVPFALLGGVVARWAGYAACLSLAAGVAVARRYAQRKTWGRALGETFGVLAVVALVVGAVASLGIA